MYSFSLYSPPCPLCFGHSFKLHSISIIDSNTRSTKALMQNNSRQFEGKTQWNIPYSSPFSFPGHHVQLLCQNIWHLADKGDLSFGDCTVALYCLDSSEMRLIFQHATDVG